MNSSNTMNSNSTPAIDGLGTLARDCLSAARNNGGRVTITERVLVAMIEEQRRIVIEEERRNLAVDSAYIGLNAGKP